jgi:alkylhydroperoxidase family enzyme
MPRLRQVPRSEAPPAVVEIYDLVFGGRDPVAEPGTATGTPGNWWTVMAGVPDVFQHCVAGFALYRSKARRLDPKLRELGQTRAGFARGSQFVFSQHCKAMRSVGFSEEQVAAIPAWSTSDAFSPLERAVLAYTEGPPGGTRPVRHLRSPALGSHGARDPRADLHHAHLRASRHDVPRPPT